MLVLKPKISFKREERSLGCPYGFFPLGFLPRQVVVTKQVSVVLYGGWSRTKKQRHLIMWRPPQLALTESVGIFVWATRDRNGNVRSNSVADKKQLVGWRQPSLKPV